MPEENLAISFPLAPLQSLHNRKRHPAGSFVKTNDFEYQKIIEKVCRREK